MDDVTQIGLIGDCSPEVRAHAAIPLALQLVSSELGRIISVRWFLTDSLRAEGGLSSMDGLWCVPGSPYASMEGALRAIRFAREEGIPFLGTCGGFQHALIEYFRNVLGLTGADHAESNPQAVMPVIAPLSCSLVGVTGDILLSPGSRVAESFGGSRARESYHCNYGFNATYLSRLQGSALSVSGVDEEGAVRAVELADHRFFVGTLFQPELSAFSGVIHPLIRAFVRAATEFHRSRPEAP